MPPRTARIWTLCAVALLATVAVLTAAGLGAAPDAGESTAEAAAARPGGPAPAPWPDEIWPRVTPEQAGLDGARLEGLGRRIAEGREIPDLHALLVVRRGYLVFERYFNGWRAESPHMLQSVSKSVTSALVGIAIGQGKLALDEKVLDYFPDVQEIRSLDDRKRRMTLCDLLTMRSGTDYHERGSDSPHERLNALSRGWDRFYLNRPMEADPGSRFQYDSGGVILMSSILKARTGMHADAFSDRHLFPALGIETVRWERNGEGHPHTGGGLDLRPLDMARFGLLYLRGGEWDGRQVVPRDWVEASTRLQVKFDRPREHIVGYGYLWWILEPDPGGAGAEPIFAAMGFLGQYIFAVPEHDLLVVVTAGARAHDDQLRPIRFLYSDILPAVMD